MHALVWFAKAARQDKAIHTYSKTLPLEVYMLVYMICASFILADNLEQ